MLLGLRSLLAELVPWQVEGCTELGEAIDAAERAMPAAALLDIRVRQAAPFPLADRLLERGVPFAFMTGQIRPSIPERFRCRPLLLKPFAAAELRRTIEDLATSPAAAKLARAGTPSPPRRPRGES